MRLLLDENLSSKVCAELSKTFGEVAHVRELLTMPASDLQIWDYALENGWTIVSKDWDFLHRSIQRGAPPKLIWLKIGNCSNRLLSELLVRNHAFIEAFVTNEAASCLVLS